MTSVAKKQESGQVSVFDYADYHAYLRDYFEEQKRLSTSFSYQYFANKAGFKSRSFMRFVILGQKDLSPKAAHKVSAVIGHDAKEAEYFEALVFFNNAKELKDKNHFLEKLQKIHRPNRKALLTAQQYDLFNKWYLIPIWEIVTYFEFAEDYRQLAARLSPPITPAEAKYAVDLLLQLGLIEKSGDRYVQKESNLHTGDEIMSRAIRNYQANTIQLAAEALTRFRKEVRNISTLSVGTNREGFAALRDRINEFRSEFVDIAARYQPSDRVYQLNVQFFPLTIVEEAEGT